MGAPVVAVSPHLDDLALSCAGFLARHPGSVMVTVFSGGPAAVRPLPDWDRDCGVFDAGDDVARVRRAEDMRAAELLEASTYHLNVWDCEYRSSAYGYEGATGAGELADAVARELERL